jgi:3-hydroxybutyryl-CoA dehydratase
LNVWIPFLTTTDREITVITQDIAHFGLDDLVEGQSFHFEQSITEEDVDRFAENSGDISPLHMDAAFARDRGMAGRVVHGMLIGAYVSRMIGVHLPGENCLLQSINLKFIAPVYVGDTVRLTAVVDQISMGAGVVILKVAVEPAHSTNGSVLVSGKVQVGFTQRKS